MSAVPWPGRCRSRRNRERRGDAPVERERCAGDEAGVVTGEIRNGGGEFLRGAESPHRVVHKPSRDFIFADVVEERAQLGCFDWTEDQRVHPHAASPEVDPQVAGVMNVALVRVLYAHLLVGAPCLALGRLAPLGRLLGDPRLGMVGAFLSLRRVLPTRYPLALDAERYIGEEQRLGRMLDYAVIVPRLQRLYEWSAEELVEPRLLELVRDGNPIYAWPFEQRHVWRSPSMPLTARLVERVTRARA